MRKFTFIPSLLLAGLFVCACSQNASVQRNSLPIGVFDSGTGGLTVLEKILSLDEFNNQTGEPGADGVADFAAEDFDYLADQANMPYGVYDSEGKSLLLRALVKEDANFLLGDSFYADAAETSPSGKKLPCKIMVIACNTATAYGLEDVKSLLALRADGTKVIGVINAGVKATLDALEGTDEPFAVGVLATPGTISSGAYERTLLSEAALRGLRDKVSVVNQSGYGFAEAVDTDPAYVDASLTAPRAGYRGPAVGLEDNCVKAALLDVYNFDKDGVLGSGSSLQLNSAASYARFNLVSLVERHRAAGSGVPLKAIILGCTHYPFQQETLQECLAELRAYKKGGKYIYRDIIAEDLVFIDPAKYVAIECYNSLVADKLLAAPKEGRLVRGFISVPSASLDNSLLTEEGLLTYEFKYGRDESAADFGTKQVPFSDATIGLDTKARIRALLPSCASELF